MNRLDCDFSNPPQCHIYVDSDLSIDGVDLYLTKEEALRLALMLQAYATGRFDAKSTRFTTIDDYLDMSTDTPGNVQDDPKPGAFKP